ncbi:MAG: hypothetical protein ACKVIQ_04775 [Acidimicrobiales bacterium]|jgi:hypothetical protein
MGARHGCGLGQIDASSDGVNLFAEMAMHIDEDDMARRREYTMDFSGIMSVDPQFRQLDLTV